MPKIEVYTRPGCGYCTHVKRLLGSKGLAFSEYDVYRHPERLTEMRRRTKGKHLPQVFIDDVPIGGILELLKLEKQNRLPKA